MSQRHKSQCGENRSKRTEPYLHRNSWNRCISVRTQFSAANTLDFLSTGFFLEILSLTHILWRVSTLISLFLYFEIIFSQGDLMTLVFFFNFTTGFVQHLGDLHLEGKCKCKCHVWQISLRSKIFIYTSASPWIRLGIKNIHRSSQLEFWSQYNCWAKNPSALK